MPADITIKVDLAASLAAVLTSRAAAVVKETEEALVERAKEKIAGGSKTGRVYTHGPQPLPHQASAAGESPANWRGILAPEDEETLIGSIKGEMTGDTEATVSVGEEGSKMADVARWLELGSPGGKIAARPYLTPARDEVEPEFNAKVARILEETP